MTIFKNKNFHRNNQKKGIALLFSVILSSILFTVAVGVIHISLNEINFNASARDTGEAFFAADVGAECALYNDKIDGPFPFLKEEPKGSLVNCVFQNNLKPEEISEQNWTFFITKLGNSQEACAVVTFQRDYIYGDPPVLQNTKIISKGYAFGDSECRSDITNRAERVLELNYAPE